MSEVLRQPGGPSSRTIRPGGGALSGAAITRSGATISPWRRARNPADSSARPHHQVVGRRMGSTTVGRVDSKWMIASNHCGSGVSSQ